MNWKIAFVAGFGILFAANEGAAKEEQHPLMAACLQTAEATQQELIIARANIIQLQRQIEASKAPAASKED